MSWAQRLSNKNSKWKATSKIEDWPNHAETTDAHRKAFFHCLQESFKLRSECIWSGEGLQIITASRAMLFSTKDNRVYSVPH